MKPSKTTLAGGTAAAAIAAAAVPGKPEWITLVLNLVAAVALALLGRHSADCPANCPGTDEHRRPRPWQRDLFPALVLVLAAFAIATACVGCVSANPKAGPAHPEEPAFVVSPELAAWSNTVHQVAQVIGPASGTGPALPSAAAGIFALIGAVSAVVARRKIAEANALAAGLVRAGPDAVQTALDHAADTRTRPAVAAAVVRARSRMVSSLGASPSTAVKSPVDATSKPR